MLKPLAGEIFLSQFNLVVHVYHVLKYDNKSHLVQLK